MTVKYILICMKYLYICLALSLNTVVSLVSSEQKSPHPNSLPEVELSNLIPDILQQIITLRIDSMYTHIPYYITNVTSSNPADPEQIRQEFQSMINFYLSDFVTISTNLTQYINMQLARLIIPEFTKQLSNNFILHSGVSKGLSTTEEWVYPNQTVPLMYAYIPEILWASLLKNTTAVRLYITNYLLKNRCLGEKLLLVFFGYFIENIGIIYRQYHAKGIYVPLANGKNIVIDETTLSNALAVLLTSGLSPDFGFELYKPTLNYSPLLIASADNNMWKITKLLISYGANIKATTYFDDEDNKQYNLLDLIATRIQEIQEFEINQDDISELKEIQSILIILAEKNLTWYTQENNRVGDISNIVSNLILEYQQEHIQE
ncbi:hypothetical protein J120_02760 [candidate division TM6 bacterium JCVI TM6SC1]|uniref:Uncharacterized protein n=1 Tax=candidate division TM6 bacterium JCVI TM6SC1 TaxID=1306947 RepID=A0A0D2GPE4_9BACT|nr:hypothetical protein J120_02760 [candidate division TM6 bacterium JCVI TM6SC1]